MEIDPHVLMSTQDYIQKAIKTIGPFFDRDPAKGAQLPGLRSKQDEVVAAEVAATLAGLRTADTNLDKVLQGFRPIAPQFPISPNFNPTVTAISSTNRP